MGHLLTAVATLLVAGDLNLHQQPLIDTGTVSDLLLAVAHSTSPPGGSQQGLPSISSKKKK
jgi:hypothetical protein